MAFPDEFMSFIYFISSIKDHIIIVGDFNIHIDVPSGDGFKFLSLIEALNLDQLVTAPTHLHGHTFDLVLSHGDQNCDGGIRVGEYISNHALVICSIDFPQPPPPTKIVSFRKYH